MKKILAFFLLSTVCHAMPPDSMIKPAAALSMDVYNDTSSSPVAGFTRILSTLTAKGEAGPVDDGYFGAAYVDSVTQPTILIIAHRGTSSLKDIVTDIDLAQEKTFSQLTDAQYFEWSVKRSMVDRYGYGDETIDQFFRRTQIQVYHTGHSLGAAIACVISAWYGDYGGYRYIPIDQGAITFENPGVATILKRWYIKRMGPSESWVFPDMYDAMIRDSASNCINVQAHENLIDTVNEQVGQTYWAIGKPYDFENMDDVFFKNPYSFTPDYYESLFYFAHMKHQHPMKPMLDYISRDGAIIRAAYPHGLEDSYLDFLDANRHADYWKKFFERAYIITAKYPESPHEKDFQTMYTKGLKILEQTKQAGSGAVNKSNNRPKINPEFIKLLDKL